MVKSIAARVIGSTTKWNKRERRYNRWRWILQGQLGLQGSPTFAFQRDSSFARKPTANWTPFQAAKEFHATRFDWFYFSIFQAISRWINPSSISRKLRVK